MPNAPFDKIELSAEPLWPYSKVSNAENPVSIAYLVVQL
jgi:hypothetical protein